MRLPLQPPSSPVGPLPPRALGGAPNWAGSPAPQAKASSAWAVSRVLSHAGSGVLSTATSKASFGISPWCPSLRQEATNASRGWVLKRGVRRADPGRGTLLAAQRQTEGTGVRALWPGMLLEEAWSALETGHHCWVAGMRQGHNSNLPPHWRPLPPWAQRGTTSRASTSQSVASSCWSLLPQALYARPSCGHIIPTWPEWISAPINLRAPVNSCFCPLSPGQRTDTWGWPTRRGRAQAKAEPQGLCN